MSVDYAAGLSAYANKGVCGLPELVEDEPTLNVKISKLCQLLMEANHVVVSTGAGISTSSGIPDFRGPNGVWTLEKRGIKPPSVDFAKAVPSSAHRALVELERNGFVHFLITQNVDGIHLRSGFPRDRLAILHGDMFLDVCNTCGTLYARSSPSTTVGLKQSSIPCQNIRPSKRTCRGKIGDTILDWESELPTTDYNIAIEQSRRADVFLCIGTSLQMEPASSLSLLSLKEHKKSMKISGNVCLKRSSPPHLVIVNLQKTKMFKRAALNIRAPADLVLTRVCEGLRISIPNPSLDPNGCFRPTIYLRSTHSPVDSQSPWNLLIHPAAGIHLRIKQVSPGPVNRDLEWNKAVVCSKRENDDEFTNKMAIKPDLSGTVD